MEYENPNYKYNPYGIAPTMEEVLAEEYNPYEEE